MNDADPIGIVRTGLANIASVEAAFGRLGFATRGIDSAAGVEDTPRLVLPGVGAFGAAMSTIERLGLAEALRRRVAAGRPTLCVCLGMQVLFARSEESPDVPGLGVIDHPVTRFAARAGVRVPQLGWNRVDPAPSCRLLSAGWAYFANSFRAEAHPDGWSCADAVHAGRFTAAIERGAVLACQFHPELSGAWGAELLSRWARVAPAEAPADLGAATGEARPC